MKTLLKLGNITVGEVSISDITIEQEYTVKDVVDLAFNGKAFVKELIKELPEMIDDLYVAFNKFNEVDAKVEAEDIWEVTSVSHSIEKDFVANFNCDLVNLYNQVCQYASNNHGNPHAIATELYRLETACAKAFIEREIDKETYKLKTDELEKIVETFNEAVRSF